MARVNVYLPDDLAAQARSADLNVSAITQSAVREALAARQTDAWLDTLRQSRSRPVDTARIMASLRDAGDDLERSHR